MFKIFDKKKTKYDYVEREVDGHRVKIQLTFVNKIGDIEIYNEFIEGAGSPEEVTEEYCFNTSFTRSLFLYNDKVVINNPYEQLQKAKIMDSRPIKIKKKFYEPISD